MANRGGGHGWLWQGMPCRAWDRGEVRGLGTGRKLSGCCCLHCLVGIPLVVARAESQTPQVAPPTRCKCRLNSWADARRPFANSEPAKQLVKGCAHRPTRTNNPAPWRQAKRQQHTDHDNLALVLAHRRIYVLGTRDGGGQQEAAQRRHHGLDRCVRNGGWKAAGTSVASWGRRGHARLEQHARSHPALGMRPARTMSGDIPKPGTAGASLAGRQPGRAHSAVSCRTTAGTDPAAPPPDFRTSTSAPAPACTLSTWPIGRRRSRPLMLGSASSVGIVHQSQSLDSEVVRGLPSWSPCAPTGPTRGVTLCVGRARSLSGGGDRQPTGRPTNPTTCLQLQAQSRT